MKDKRDPKFPILPSTTRKGTALNSKAALDSPTVLNKLVTPPPHASHVASASSDTVSDEFDDASTILDKSSSSAPFLDTLVAKSKEIEFVEISNENIVTPIVSPEEGNYGSSYPDDAYIDVDDEFIRECMECYTSNDPNALKRLLEKHALKNKFISDP